MAPVVGSGSWPAWMQSVAKAIGLPRFTRDCSIPCPGGAERVRGRLDLTEPPGPGQELAAFRGGQGTREQEPLHAVALARGQELELLLRLHPFRDHAELQGVGEGDDRG